MKSTGQRNYLYCSKKQPFLSYSEYYHQPLTLISAALLVHIINEHLHYKKAYI